MSTPLSQALLVRDSIRDCTRCSFRKTAKEPIPWSGPTPARLAILGQAPGWVENDEGRPFIGPAGSILDVVLKATKFIRSNIAILNTCCCYPGREKGGDVAPGPVEIEACRRNLLNQLAVIQPLHILLMGQTALHAFRPDLKLAWMRGRPLFYNGREDGFWPVWWGPAIHLWPTYHPAAALRWAGRQHDIEADLRAFRTFRENDDGPWPEDCVVCGGEVHRFDAWGVGKCVTHWAKQEALF